MPGLCRCSEGVDGQVAAQLAIQPGTCGSPVAADGAPGDAERVGGFLRAQAAAYAAPDHLRCARIGFLPATERLVEREQLRSEERRVGTECVSTCRSRGTPVP